MNKTKKLATIAVSVVLAGAMAMSVVGCSNNKKPNDDNKPDNDDNKPTITTQQYADGTVVRTAIGYKDDTSAIKFGNDLPLVDKDGKATTSIKLPNGKTYGIGELKPIWNSYEEALKVSISDQWPQSSKTLTDCDTKGLQNYDLIGAGSLDEIQTAIDGGKLLNLAEYWDYLPNLKHFLEQNTLAELGTLSNTKTGATYYSPYYGGMNDAERFNLFRTDQVSELLDHANLAEAATKNGGTVTFAYQAKRKLDQHVGGRGENETYDGTKSSVESYMGQTGEYVVETTDPADSLKTVFVKVNYEAALKAAKDETTDLGKAIKEGAGKKFEGTSGNIVDLQNFVINAKNGEVGGEHLLAILRAYIDVAYEWSATKTGTYAKFYNSTVNGVATKRGDVFNSKYGAWDVDLYAAIGRCFVTCGNLIGEYQAQAAGTAGQYTNNGASTWLFVTRTGKLDRLTRMTAMIGELYGVRGMEAMMYLDSSGTLRQARFNVTTWDAFQKFSAFHTEGLTPSFYNAATADTQVNGKAGNQSTYYNASRFQALSSNDFIHTQATLGGSAEASSPIVTTQDGYTWTGVSTPVSKWLTNDTSKVSSSGAVTPDFNGKLSERPAAKCTVMRFTESALKLKTGGLVIPKVITENKDRLYATLALMDYIYSPDGQTVTTFGDVSTTDNLTGSDAAGYTTTNDGWWYGKAVTKLTIDGKETDVSGMSMKDLEAKKVVESFDGGKQYTMTAAYQSQALVYKNKLYITGTDSNGDYPNGYIYNGVMTPYATQAVLKLVYGGLVNGYKHTGAAWSSTNLQNLVLGAESHGIINNGGMVQLCLPMAIEGFEIISTGFGNGSIQTVKQGIGENPWFTCAPSVTLPKGSSDEIKSYSDFTNLFATKAGDALLSNYLFTEVGWFGAEANLNSWTLSSTTAGSDISTPEAIVAMLKKAAPAYESLNNAAWSSFFAYYTDVIAKR